MAPVTRYSAKRRASRPRQMDQELDKVNQLPEPLIDKILSHLPIRDAVRTSILSSKWRYRWTTLSKLVFDDECTSNGKSSSRLVKIINSVLLRHSGPVEKFTLSHKKYKATWRDIDRWILHLSNVAINELCLDVWERPSYKVPVPSCLFSCQNLTSLKLCKCSLNLPPTFRGFKNLKSLWFESVHIPKQGLEDLISGSYLLEDLTLISYVIFNLNIEAPKLKHLYLSGAIEGISFKSTHYSPSFHMEFDENKTGLSVEANARKGYINLLKFSARLQNVETLRLDGHVLKYLSVQEVPEMLPEPFVRLESLFISDAHFNSVKEISVILCLLRSAPNLKQIEFLALNEENPTYADIVGVGTKIYDSPFTFPCLDSASVIGIRDTALELGFVRILLSSSPALKKMTIKAANFSNLYPHGDYNLLKHLVHFRRASPHVEVIFLENSSTGSLQQKLGSLMQSLDSIMQTVDTVQVRNREVVRLLMVGLGINPDVLDDEDDD